MAKAKNVPSLHAASTEQFWRFVVSSHRSVYDPWWATAACERAWQAWSATDK